MPDRAQIREKFNHDVANDLRDLLTRFCETNVMLTRKDGKEIPMAEVAIEDLKLEFARIMVDMPEEDIPAWFFKQIMEFQTGESVRNGDAEHEIAKYIFNSRKEDDKKRGIRGAVPSFLEGLEQEGVELRIVETYAELWHQMVGNMAKLALPAGALSATLRAEKDLETLDDCGYTEKSPRAAAVAQAQPKGLASDKSQPAENETYEQKRTRIEKILKAKEIDGAKIHWAENIENVDAELEKLVGLEKQKEQVRAMRDRMEMAALKEEITGCKSPKRNLEHASLRGPSGTGKTTFARLMGKIYRDAGILRSGHVIEVGRTALISKWIGETSPRTEALCDAARDGILFIDEAYALNQEGKDYGAEVISTLIPRMVEGDMVVVFAGYSDEMSKFIESNPGLTSRVKYFMDFDNFTDTELMTIFDRNLAAHGFEIDEDGRKKISNLITSTKEQRGKHFGNARAVENMVDLLDDAQAAVLRRSGRLAEIRTHKMEGAVTDQDRYDLTHVSAEAIDRLGASYIKQETPKIQIGFDTTVRQPGRNASCAPAMSPS